MILAGSSLRACPDCGSPWERVIEVSYDKHRPSAGDDARSRQDDRLSRYWDKHGYKANNLLRRTKTIGWRPTCAHYDELYKTEFPKARSSRKRWQRDVSGDWWKRVRKRPGKPHWQFKPCVVLDPFIGSGTTAVVAANLKRDYIGSDANPEYVEMAKKRIRAEASNLVFAF